MTAQRGDSSKMCLKIHELSVIYWGYCFVTSLRGISSPSIPRHKTVPSTQEKIRDKNRELLDGFPGHWRRKKDVTLSHVPLLSTIWPFPSFLLPSISSPFNNLPLLHSPHFYYHLILRPPPIFVLLFHCFRRSPCLCCVCSHCLSFFLSLCLPALTPLPPPSPSLGPPSHRAPLFPTTTTRLVCPDPLNPPNLLRVPRPYLVLLLAIKASIFPVCLESVGVIKGYVDHYG